MSLALAAVLRTCADQSEIGRNFAATPHACREAAEIVAPTARPLSAYHEDMGPVLWWVFPVCEAPWCGRPDDSDWPGYHTHFTRLPATPVKPKESA